MRAAEHARVSYVSGPIRDGGLAFSPVPPPAFPFASNRARPTGRVRPHAPQRPIGCPLTFGQVRLTIPEAIGHLEPQHVAISQAYGPPCGLR